MQIQNVTFNLRGSYSPNQDNEQCFHHRLPLIIEKINSEKPDIICFQEVMPTQKKALSLSMQDYNFYGEGRDNDLYGEGVYIAVKGKRFWVLECRSFWLSPTPFAAGTRFVEDQSICPRICTVLTLEEISSGIRFRIYNTHTDHIGTMARQKGTKVLLEQIEKDNAFFRMPFFVEGDLNAQPDTKEIQMLKDFGLRDLAGESGCTFHNFGNTEALCKIDYIFASDEITGLGLKVWKDRKYGIYLSDHYPVSVIADIKG